MHKQSLFHISKRDALPWYQAMLIRGGAIVLALIVCALVTMLLTGENPISIYGTIFYGAFGTARKSWVTFQNLAVLLGISLAVTPAFKMRFWNIGAEGQVLIGCLATAACMIVLGDKLSNGVLILVMLVAAIAAGSLWGFLPSFFKAKWNTNETLLTLMLNYIALYIISWLQNGPWRDPTANGFPKIAAFAKNAVLGKVLGVQAGWIVMLVFTVLVWVYLKFTKQGYEVAVVGESQDTARYAGIHVKKVILRTMFLSGAIGGVCGMLQACGTDATLSTGIAGGVGFTAIIVAWLCQLNPGMILVVSFLFGVLEKGSSVVQSSYGLSTDCAAVLQGIILFFILASEFFVRYAFAGRSSAKGGKKA